MNPKKRGIMTSQRVVTLFKLVNVLAGYQRTFSKTMHTRLGYWRAVLNQDGGQFPSLADPNIGPLPNPRIRQIQRLLACLLDAERREDASHVSQRIAYVSLQLTIL